jgi:hypothetical protein
VLDNASVARAAVSKGRFMTVFLILAPASGLE